MKNDDGINDFAFPVAGALGANQCNGMSLRDYFAAKAMAALIVMDGSNFFGQRAMEAYEMADAMLKERSK